MLHKTRWFKCRTLCKIENDSKLEKTLLDKQHFARFAFKTHLGRISFITTCRLSLTLGSGHTKTWLYLPIVTLFFAEKQRLTFHVVVQHAYRNYDFETIWKCRFNVKFTVILTSKRRTNIILTLCDYVLNTVNVDKFVIISGDVSDRGNTIRNVWYNNLHQFTETDDVVILMKFSSLIVSMLLFTKQLQCCSQRWKFRRHYSDVIMSAMASQLTGISFVCFPVCSGADQRKHQSSASLPFVRGIHWWPADSPHKGPVTRKMFPFDDVIIKMEDHFCHCIALCLFGFVLDDLYIFISLNAFALLRYFNTNHTLSCIMNSRSGDNEDNFQTFQGFILVIQSHRHCPDLNCNGNRLWYPGHRHKQVPHRIRMELIQN